METSINFELTKTFKYNSHSGGGEVECAHIELREPTGKVSHTCCAIEGLIQTALMKMSSDLSESDIEKAREDAANNPRGDDKDPEAIMAVVTGGGADMEKVVLHFKDLFRQVAYMGGEKAITEPRLNEMSHTDFRKMVGVYLVNFILS